MGLTVEELREKPNPETAEFFNEWKNLAQANFDIYDQIHEQWKRAPSVGSPTNKILPIPDQNSFTYSKRGGFGKLNGLILPYGYQSHFEILSKFDLFSNGPKLDRFKCKKQ